MDSDKVLALAEDAGFDVESEGMVFVPYGYRDGMQITEQITKFAALIQQQMIADGWRSPEQVKADLVDAERYRYFKRHLHEPHAISHFVMFNNWHPDDEEKLRDLDAAIDKARSENE